LHEDGEAKGIIRQIFISAQAEDGVSVIFIGILIA
jgi:hypothetical protein